MALRGVDDEIARCRTARGEARARLVISIRFLPNGSTLFENVGFDDVVDLVPAEIDCIRETVMGRELAVRTVDATMLGLSPGTTVVYEPRADLSFSFAGHFEFVSVHARPTW